MIQRIRWQCPQCRRDFNIPAGKAPDLCPACDDGPSSTDSTRQRIAHRTKTCPFCAEPIALDAIKCKHCGSMLVQQIHPPNLGPRSGVGIVNYPPNGITVPLLISAIANIVVGLFWLSTCFGAVLTVPMVVLCIFEFVLYSQASDLDAPTLASRAQMTGIFEILVGLFNTPTLVCGILLLIHSSKLSRTTLR